MRVAETDVELVEGGAPPRVDLELVWTAAQQRVDAKAEATCQIVVQRLSLRRIERHEKHRQIGAARVDLLDGDGLRAVSPLGDCPKRSQVGCPLRRLPDERFGLTESLERPPAETRAVELSHLWGPALRVKETGSGGKADALIGFPFHWSFWLDAGSSPAGGNPWRDNGDGTFTVSGQSPTTVRFSMLDLYLMGLADPSEVKPFGVLENAVAPGSFKDPYTRRGLDAASFPYWGSTPLTVTATRRTVTIDEVVAVNGARSPARAEAQLTLGVVLMVPKDATDEAILDLEKEFEPLAASLAPSFGAATSGRGQMELLTAEASTPAEGGVPTAATPSTDATQTTGPSGDSGCTAVPSRMTPPWFSALAVMGLLALGRRLRHAQARRTSERHSETVAASKGLESTMGARVPSSRRATSVSGAPVIRTTVASRPGQRAATSR